MNEEYRRWVRHIAEADEPLEIAGPRSDPDNPPLSEADFARMKPRNAPRGK